MKLSIKIVFTGLLVLLDLFVRAQDDTISQRIVLIGDAGQLTDGKHPVVDAVRNTIPLDKKTTVLFLGDNLYKNGLPDKQFTLLYTQAKAVLDSQLYLVKGTKATAYMIPGNHDWKNGKPQGYDAIVRQQFYVEFLIAENNIKYLPREGCPGPNIVKLGTNVIIVIFDSQWWLHPYDKPGLESDCTCKNKDELVTQIRNISRENADKLIILADHHPFKSNGIHGGYFTLKQHLFPLTDIKKYLYIPMPVIGSIYPIARSVFGTPQDLNHPIYAEMIEQVTEAVTSACPNVIFVSGHDHNLQYIKEDGHNYIISGGGCKQNRTSKNKNSLFNSTDNGFAVLEISTNNTTSVSFYTVTDSIRKVYSGNVLTIKKTIPDTDKKPELIEPSGIVSKDSITIAASQKIRPVTGLRKFFMGQNYRKEWSTPVSMKIFRLAQEKGGFKIERLGGGTQTKSLHLTNIKTNENWVLRNVNKNPLKPVPGNFETTLSTDFYLELLTAAHPYAPLAIPVLANALHVQAPKPELFYLPDDPALGIYRSQFANNVYTLEKSDPSIDSTNTDQTHDILFSEMMEDNDHITDQPATLRARLLDMIIGDYDRHFDQWKWGTYDSTRGKGFKGTIYYPIPRDRDQAFFNPEGKMMKMISAQLPFLKGFSKNFPDINGLGFKAKEFDRIFLSKLDQPDWEKTIAEVRQELSDSVLKLAVQKMPPEIYNIHGNDIIQKMASRRDLLSTAGIKYYRFLSKTVSIIGSNQKEYFKVSNAGKNLQVRVYDYGKNYDTSFMMYNRVFDPSVTKEIRLYGLNDDDYFDVDNNVKSSIKIRIIGGRGSDTFDIKGHVKTFLYDLKEDSLNKNIIINQKDVKNRFSADPPLNERSILSFDYNTVRLPQLQFGYNTDDRFLTGAGLSVRTYGFRKIPYATDQKIRVLFATDRPAVKFMYNGEFNNITPKIDLLINTEFASPAAKNFFGLGNNTKIDGQGSYPYYQARFRSFFVEALLRKRIFETLHLMAGPYFQNYFARFSDNSTTILGKPLNSGLDSASIFTTKNYLGAKAVLLVDNRNNQLFPTRGIEWRSEFTALKGFENSSNNFTAYTSDMTLYTSMKYPARFVVVTKIGGGKILSKNYEYFQAINFGANNGLAAFRKNRFAGKSSLYGSMEFRIKLFDINSYIAPGPFGLLAFVNTGRVWTDQEVSKKWHTGIGGGFYYIPFNRFIISASAGFSGNEKVVNFTIGTKFNLTY